MCRLLLVLCILSKCALCIFINRRPFAALPFLKSGVESHVSAVPTTFDRIPVFCVALDRGLLMRMREGARYSHFMDYADSYDTLVAAYMHGVFDKNQPCSISTTSLKSWFEAFKAPKKRNSKTQGPRLLPSSVQDKNLAYKLKRTGEQDTIPVYYSDRLRVRRRSFWSRFFPVKNEDRAVYFFNHGDLVREIVKIEDKLERERALKDVKVASLLDLLERDDAGKLLFVISSENAGHISEMAGGKTPWTW